MTAAARLGGMLNLGSSGCSTREVPGEVRRQEGADSYRPAAAVADGAPHLKWRALLLLGAQTQIAPSRPLSLLPPVPHPRPPQQQQDKRPAVVEGAADSVAAWDHLLHGLRDLASETRGQYAAQLAAAGLTVEAFGQVGPDYLAFLHTGVQGTIPAVHFAMIHQLARQ